MAQAMHLHADRKFGMLALMLRSHPKDQTTSIQTCLQYVERYGRETGAQVDVANVNG